MFNGLKKKLKEDPEVANTLSGGLAGAITATVVCPLDVLKTRLQVQRKAAVQYAGIGGGLSKIMREEGVRGLYRGLTPTLMALLPNWAVYFTVYERLKTTIGSRVAPKHAHSPGVHMAAAACAGAATMIITNPLWVIKTRLQTQNMGIRMGATNNPALYKGTLDAFMRIAREEGVAGLYSGLGPSLLGVMHVVIQFPLYESMKNHFVRHPLLPHEHDEKRLSMTELVLASAASKMVASTATYPHEVIRSRMHIAGTGAFTGLFRTCQQEVLQIYREDGLLGFYRGCMTNLLRTTPAAAVTFTSFEVINRRLREWAVSADAASAAADAAPAAPKLPPRQQQRQQGQQLEQQLGEAPGQALHGPPFARLQQLQRQGAAAATPGEESREGVGAELRDPQQLESHLSSELGGVERRDD